MVKDENIAWHAGISSWKKDKSLNSNSIGIEISNPGHAYKYRKFSQKQIASIIKLSKNLKKNIAVVPIINSRDSIKYKFKNEVFNLPYSIKIFTDKT